MPNFPMFVSLAGKRVIILGGGAVALRKLRKLLPYDPAPVVIAPEILPEIQAMAGVTVRRRPFRAWDLSRKPALVIAATNDRKVNARAAALCKKRGIPVNVADDPALCTFLFPALVQQGKFSAGISTGGASPTAAVYYKELLQDQLPPNLDVILAYLDAQRPMLKQAIPDQSRRAGILRAMFDRCIRKGDVLNSRELEDILWEKPLGTVSLVGAGCGKADLITLRGLRLLQRCQAVVYDDLIDPALLEAAPETAQRIYMGKRSGAHSASQAEINETLIALARSGLDVVRLKGGDPYLFGRGGEEMLALQKAGIPCREVPGIPSAIGIPAEMGIPVTHRGASQGLHIITAHTADTPDGLPRDFDALAKLNGTLVFLMGLGQLPRIADRLMAGGKDVSTPTAVLSGGNSPNPVTVRAPLGSLAQAAKAAKAASPAIILVGPVAAMDLNTAPGGRPDGFSPLSGIRVGITGTDSVALKQVSVLEALGAETVRLAQSRIVDRALPETLSDLTLEPCWAVFTSPNGVRSLLSRVSPQVFSACKIAAIGSSTGNALEDFGLRVSLCPGKFTSVDLAHALQKAAQPGEKILLLRSSIGSRELPEILREAGFSVEDIPVYDLEPVFSQEALPEGLNYLTFASASGVELFFKTFGAVPPETKCVCIGGVTARALEAHLDAPFLTAAHISVQGMVDAILAQEMDPVSGGGPL